MLLAIQLQVEPQKNSRMSEGQCTAQPFVGHDTQHFLTYAKPMRSTRPSLRQVRTLLLSCTASACRSAACELKHLLVQEAHA